MTESVGTGIAGAMDYHPAIERGLACIACGAEIHGGMKGAPRARACPGLGVIHACGDACGRDPRFNFRLFCAPVEDEG